MYILYIPWIQDLRQGVCMLEYMQHSKRLVHKRMYAIQMDVCHSNGCRSFKCIAMHQDVYS